MDLPNGVKDFFNKDKPGTGTQGATPPAGQQGAGTPPPPAGNAEKKVFAYRCTEDCTFMSKFRKKGDVIYLPEEKKVPYFELVGK